MKDDVAIKVDGVYKDFKLPHERTNSLKSAVMSIGKKKRKGYEVQHALKNMSFEVKKGEFFGIVGRNGSGKSTLLKIIAEIYRPTKGSVKKSGRLVPFIELGVGFNPELTGRENVYLNGALLGFSKKEVEAMYDDIVEFAELEKFMDQKLKNYSSGMQVRLAFSVATRAKADILLIDEVLAVGDADFQRKCFNYFRTLKQENRTVVFVSHDMDAVQEYCDRAMLVENSEQLDTGDPSRISMEYKKLFNKSNETKKGVNKKPGPSGESRWGDEKLYFKDINATISHDESTIQIIIDVVSNDEVERPIFGFSIKNQVLQQLIGTNTARKHIEIKPMKKKEERQYIWTLPNVLNEGKYYIDCTVAHDNALNVSDRWPDAVTLEITRDEKNPYIIYSPDVVFKQSNK